MTKYPINRWYSTTFYMISAIVICLLALVSCQKENNFSSSAPSMLTQKEVEVFPKRPYNKQVSVTEQTTESQVSFLVQSNDKEILEAFSQKDALAFTFKPSFNFTPTSTPLNQKTTDRPTALKENRSIVSIELTAITTNTLSASLPSYTLSFSEAIKNLIKEKNTATLILFKDKIKVYDSNATTAKSRNSEPYIEIWNNNKMVQIQGDGGDIKTHTDNWWAEYGNGQDIHYLNSSRFLNVDYTSTCCLQSSQSDPWVRGILVTNDVVSRVDGIANCCDDFDSCYDEFEDNGPGCQGPTCREDNAFTRIETKNMALFFATEMQQTGNDLITILLENQEELTNMIYSKKPQHQRLQQKFDKLWASSYPIMKKSFSGNNQHLVTSKQVELGIQFLEELEKTTTSKKLTYSILKIKQQLPILKNKPLKEGLIDFDRLEFKLLPKNKK